MKIKTTKSTSRDAAELYSDLVSNLDNVSKFHKLIEEKLSLMYRRGWKDGIKFEKDAWWREQEGNTQWR